MWILETLSELANIGVDMNWLISGASQRNKSKAGFWGQGAWGQFFLSSGEKETSSEFFPSMWGGEPQRSLSLTLAVLPEEAGQGMDTDALRLFKTEDTSTLMPYWGITAGDLVLVDTVVTHWQGEGVYVVELEPEKEPQLRAVIRRGGSLWFEHSPASMDHQAVLDSNRILGKVVWRAGAVE